MPLLQDATQGDSILHTADFAASPRARRPIGAAVLFSGPTQQRTVVMLWAHTAAQATRHGAHRPTHKHTPRRAARVWLSGVSAVPVQMWARVSAVPVQMWPTLVSTHVRTHLRSLRRERQLSPVLWFGLPRVVQLRDHLLQRVHNVPPGMAYNMQRTTRRTTYTCRTV